MIRNEKLQLVKNLKRKEVTDFAESLVGTPYKRGARPRFPEELIAFDGKKIQEVDCSSFVVYVFWKALQLILPPSTIEQATSEFGKIIPSFSEAMPGDLLFFQGEKGYYDFSKLPGIYVGHVAILHFENKIIHAVNSGGKSGVIMHPFTPEQHSGCHPKTIMLIKRFI
jgi:cell wall-associated NlpC family hydrolase